MNDAARPAPDYEEPDSHPVTTHYATFDWEEYEPISSAVVDTVARAASVPSSDLPELYDTVEPNALDQLFRSLQRSRSSGRFTFTYEGFEVTVCSTGKVVVCPADAEHSRSAADPR